MRRVEVRPYDEKWIDLFEEEKKKLSSLFQSQLVAIHHIGSTSVSGLSAKPVIDILPVVKEIGRVDGYNENMRALGYEARGENGLPGRRFFLKGGEDRTHHVHVFEQGNDEITRHLAFRDYLRNHPSDRNQYARVKRELAERYPYDIESYIEGKNQLVSVIQTKALEWFNKDG
ncbi:GrpB family protein [Halobacillus litoralis]|uniref:GrpB family protein n=1 Tax=Halobacillus litoralis TaxID=45668 RepID=UPI001CFDDCC5|nr:GrpB family protein [Halobacillus litoralis]